MGGLLDTGTDSLEVLISRLRLHNGAWAMEIKGDLYVFPSEITREEAVEVLKKAYDYYHTKHN